MRTTSHQPPTDQRSNITGYVLGHQADRFLLRPPSARLRRRLQTSAWPQRSRRDRCRVRHARFAQHGHRLRRHQARGQGLDRPRARSQNDSEARRSAGEADAGARRAYLPPRQQSDGGAHRATGLRRVALTGTPCHAGHRLGNADFVGDLRRLIVFVRDGTLVDSRRDLADSANALIVESGGAPLTEEAIGRMVGEGAATLVRRALAATGLRDVRGALARFLEIYDTRLLNHTRAYEGIEDAVRRARAIGRVAVLTNKPERPTRTILQGLGLDDLFDEVRGGDGPLPRKPDPASLRQLMAASGASPRSTVMVGDSWVDYQTARAARAEERRVG